ncbi:MAG: cobalamin-independent methionine synthase II family protein [Acidimicrobiales bacterium]|nr:cobalamin-independent methionine synthase II family protein [Acidimicrobiales bacterium]
MLTATAGVTLPTAIIGSLPRPRWYTESLGRRSFLEAMVDANFREQYTDVVSVYLRDQELAGLDIVTDGDSRFAPDVGGQSWTGYPTQHMDGFERDRPLLARAGATGVSYPRGHILHDYLEARVVPRIVGPVGPGELQYAELWKTAQRLTTRPVKFGTVTPELVAFSVEDAYYGDLPSRIMAISDAFNAELHDLADAGCKVIQLEEPQIHLLAAKGIVDDVITPKLMLEVFNNTVKGLRDKAEVWCHTCWGNPSQQRMFDKVQSYLPALEILAQVDADVLTFETRSSGPAELEAIGRHLTDDTDKKVGIGVIDHHTLQVESPEEVADLARAALRSIPAERLVLCTDCGMGREGMSRRHATYKMVSLVLGANLVRLELGVPPAECLAAEGRYSLIRSG